MLAAGGCEPRCEPDAAGSLARGILLTHACPCLPSNYNCRDTADSLRDFYYGLGPVTGPNRVQGASNMMLEAMHWLRGHFPYWWVAVDGRNSAWRGWAGGRAGGRVGGRSLCCCTLVAAPPASDAIPCGYLPASLGKVGWPGRRLI
jgi:hypothetical protein